MQKKILTANNNLYYKLLGVLTKKGNKTAAKKIIDNTFLKVLDLFIGDCILNTNGINYKLFFNKKNVSWGVLDEALKHAYPNHYIPDKNGFIFLNVKRRKDINKIHETPHNFFNPYK